jgi:integrase/cold shock CspA family protein
MTLSVLQIQAAKPASKPYKLFDRDNLYLIVTPKGSKLWRFDYRLEGVRKTLALGQFPDVKLAEARDLRDAARKTVRGGDDPAEPRRLKRAEARAKRGRDSFAAIAKRWFAARQRRWCPAYAARIWSRIDDDLIRSVGNRPIQEVTGQHLLAALRKIEERGSVETARRVRCHAEDLFKFARAEGLVADNPAANLIDALARPAPPRHRAALKARDLRPFLEALATYDGEAATRLAVEFVLLTFVRTQEARLAQWDEFEGLEGPSPLWRIPAERMKMRSEHLVPLAPRVVAILLELKTLAEDSPFVFPGVTGAGVMSCNTMIYGLYRMGYHSRATIHGFRRTASTTLNEHGFNADWIERQLAHTEQNDVRSAYNAAEYLAQRRTMMLWWADYIDAVRHGLAPRAPDLTGQVPARPASRRGVVRCFDQANGRGFIAPLDGGPDVFVHVSEVRKSGLPTLRPGEAVAFEAIEGPVPETQVAVQLQRCAGGLAQTISSSRQAAGPG